LKKYKSQDHDPHCQPKDHGGNALKRNFPAESAQQEQEYKRVYTKGCEAASA
jgi:hypothetical protein